MDPSGQPLMSAAQRRKQRRLRSWWRHEQQSIAAVLATVTHHSHSKVGTANAALRGQKTGTSTRGGPAEYYELSSDDGGPTGGERPAALSEPWPQGKLLRHAGVGYELVHRLEVPVPQMGEQLPDVLQFFATFLPFVAEQVIEVPKIALDTIPQRLGDVLRQPQMVEQLVDVPTVVSYSSLQQLTAEQNVDNPVSGRDGGGTRGGLQGSLPGQNSAAVHVEQTVDIPVPRRRRRRSGSPQGSLPGRGSTANLEQIVDTPARDSPQGFLPGQSSSSSSRSHDGPDAGIQGVFRTFPRMKKSAGQGPHPGSELGADFTSTLSAHQMPPEQLVDVTVPQVPVRSSSRLLYEQSISLLERLNRREAEEAARLALLEEEQMDEDEEEEEVEVSRFLPHFRPRRWCWYVRAGSICTRGWDCTFAHHESELHPDSW